MGRAASRYWSALRTAAWLDAGRARAYAWIFAAMAAALSVAYLALSSGVHDPLGRALGTDFASFWTASHLALSGNPAAAWDVSAHRASQTALFGEGAGYAAFFYPPPYLLLCLPLALLPYTVSLAVWLATTGAAWMWTVRGWLGREAGWLPVAAFPAVLVNAGHGQNGFLTAALLGAAALVAQRRPWVSGILFGLLVVKPHVAILVPLFLLVSGNWRALLAAGLTAAGLCLGSLVALGPDAWRGFFENAALARAALEAGLVGYAKMQSAYAGMRLLGGSDGTAWLVQACATLAAAMAVWATRRGTETARGAVLACATPLATPFLLDYDLTIMAIPMAWLLRTGVRAGFMPWEKLMLLAAFVLPLAGRMIGTNLGVPVTPFVVLGLLLCVVRRAGSATEAPWDVGLRVLEDRVPNPATR